MSAAPESPPSKVCHGPPPPAELTNNTSSLQLLSQGAEARVWLVTLPDPSKTRDDSGISGGGSGGKKTLHVGSGINVPQLLSFSQQPSPLSTTQTSSKPLKIVCKERFPKKYRHPQLDISLTKSRTKGEARSLIRCQRAGVPCPNVLAIAHWSINKDNETDGESMTISGKSESNGIISTSTTSSCLFLECVDGCTVRQYFEQRSVNGNEHAVGGDKGDEEPTMKRPRCEDSTSTATASNSFQQEERVTTVIDSQTLSVGHTIGTLVAKMHAAGVIHGDLTTSNIMIRNPTHSCNGGDISWKPQLVLIDFGLAASTATANNKNTNNSSSSNKKAKPFKQQHNAEEKAVDLYVLERAFLSTHPESELLVEEVWKGYRGYFEGLDNYEVVDDTAAGDGKKSDAAGNSGSSRGAGEGTYGHVAKAVLNRLEQVRMRGRKRECFG